MAQTILKIGKRAKQDDFIEIFDVSYRTLSERDQGNVKVVGRAKELAVQYKDMDFGKMDANKLSFDETLQVLTLVDDLVRLVLPTLKDDVLMELEATEKIQILQAYFESENGKELLAGAGLAQSGLSASGLNTRLAATPVNRSAKRARSSRPGAGKPLNQSLPRPAATWPGISGGNQAVG